MDGHDSFAVLYLTGELSGLRRHERTKSIDDETPEEYVARLKEFDGMVQHFHLGSPRLMQFLSERNIACENVGKRSGLKGFSFCLCCS